MAQLRQLASRGPLLPSNSIGISPGDRASPPPVTAPRPLAWAGREPARPLVAAVLRTAGIHLGGDQPWDVQVTDPRFYSSVLLRGSLGFGESYMRGWWHVEDLEEVAYRLSRAGLHWVARALPPHLVALAAASFSNRQTRTDSVNLVDRHYNLGNDLFRGFLGRSMVYSCAYFDDTESLDRAQELKLDLICRRLGLKAGERLLDIGGGWGEFARHAALHYGCHVTSINIADEQIRHARERCAGLPVEIVKCDYRDLRGSFDKVAVIAMLTHVGHSNYRRFMTIVHDCLATGGRVLVETLGSRISKVNCEPWTNRYIFPGGVVPSLRQIDRAADGLLARTEVTEFGHHYVPTLRSWNANLHASWPQLAGRYPETTRLMLGYFFLTVAGAFRAGHLKYWHVQLQKG
jgi:cyclopropane-fatty-acyl-phospholipid synthase